MARRALSPTVGATTNYPYDENGNLATTVAPQVNTEVAGGNPVATHTDDAQRRTVLSCCPRQPQHPENRTAGPGPDPETPPTAIPPPHEPRHDRATPTLTVQKRLPSPNFRRKSDHTK
jgi:hypothetical protein